MAAFYGWSPTITYGGKTIHSVKFDVNWTTIRKRIYSIINIDPKNLSRGVSNLQIIQALYNHKINSMKVKGTTIIYYVYNRKRIDLINAKLLAEFKGLITIGIAT